jgi:hypothetical protein
LSKLNNKHGAEKPKTGYKIDTNDLQQHCRRLPNKQKESAILMSPSNFLKRVEGDNEEIEEETLNIQNVCDCGRILSDG